MKSSISLLALSAALAIGPASGREFEDKFGRTISADLISHAGATAEAVTIKKAGKEMRVKLDLFSEKDQIFIREWMKKTPATVNYAFRISAERKEVKAAQEKDKPDDPFAGAAAAAGASADGEKFELKVTNLTRQPVGGLELKYRVYVKDYPSSLDDLRSIFEDRVKGAGGLPSGKGAKLEATLEHIEDRKPIEGELNYNQTVAIETKPITIHAGKNPLNGDRYKDEIVGIIVRIFDKGGEMVYEYRDKKTADYKWAVDEPKEEFGIILD